MRDNCTPSRRKECARGCGGPERLAAVCARCRRREPYVPTAWFSYIFFLNRLQAAGYPFEKNDLTTEEWFAVGEMKLLLDTPRIPDGK